MSYISKFIYNKYFVWNLPNIIRYPGPEDYEDYVEEEEEEFYDDHYDDTEDVVYEDYQAQGDPCLPDQFLCHSQVGVI